MHRLRKDVWRLYLHAQNLMSIYIWQNNGYNTYRSQTPVNNIDVGITSST